MRAEYTSLKIGIPKYARCWAISVASFLGTLLLLFCVYAVFQHYDWGHPIIKLLCFTALFALTALMYTHKSQRDGVGSLTLKIEAMFALVLLSVIVVNMLSTYLPYVTAGPTVDIGYTTQRAAEILLLQGQNPYLDQTINIRPELAPEHRGFHYGPGMIIGYALSAFLPDLGYKLTSLFYLAVTAIALCMLISHTLKSKGKWEVYCACLVAMLLFFMPERLWYEVLKVGANDIFPVALLLVGLVFVQREKWLIAGFLMGLSFAAKFSPAAFLLAMFLRTGINLNFLIGCVLGASPLLAMMAWDYHGLVENVFILRFTLHYDATSLYSVTPEAFHMLFPLTQLGALVYLIRRNMKKSLTIEDVIVCFTLLLIVVEVTFKEIHANHLIWFYPLIAFIATLYRHKVFPKRP
ncbi:DUF2029 domain-containing protein [Enterovibrio sp. ZSDZ35]|uniref:DUF2029 domain-containing protein n=1 Tax=Enterovibrio qingdaonensis TaxID=2899818 RepID=A0ABT5QQV2_9GAMM|nr:glycosyltransferase family 87 protein [Enterovibrio sp. ZSDZ35]MDD1783371.1 DUF2029 domain-containing protein [Enterovibrio sp. ZSDZ35]